jgi:hypothetical protein
MAVVWTVRIVNCWFTRIALFNAVHSSKRNANPLADALGISITDLIMGERTQETIAEDTVIHDLVDISMNEQHRKI